MSILLNEACCSHGSEQHIIQLLPLKGLRIYALILDIPSVLRDQLSKKCVAQNAEYFNLQPTAYNRNKVT